MPATAKSENLMPPPTHAQRERILEKERLLVQLIKNLNIKNRFERSVKISEKNQFTAVTFSNLTGGCIDDQGEIFLRSLAGIKKAISKTSMLVAIRYA